MGSSDRLFNRQKSVHQLLGGGFIADVILWRQKNMTVSILIVVLSAWIVFERSRYTLLSLVSSVLLLLLTILFLWAKSASLLNRPAPPLPELHLSEDMVRGASDFIRTHVNDLLSVSQDIALGNKDSRLFFKVAGYLCFTAIVGGLSDLPTLGYISLVLVLTLPAFYENYEDYIDKYVMMGYLKLKRLYVKLDEQWFQTYQIIVSETSKIS